MTDNSLKLLTVIFAVILIGALSAQAVGGRTRSGLVGGILASLEARPENLGTLRTINAGSHLGGQQGYSLCNVLAKPTLLSPSGDTTANPTYSWNAVSEAEWYQLWVNDSATSAKIQQWYTTAQTNCASGTGICSITPSAKLAPGAGSWWIQAWNSCGGGNPSAWSDGMTFTVRGLTIPGKVTLISPSGAITTFQPAFTWNAGATATWYLLWVNDSVVSPKIQSWFTAAQAGCPSGAGVCSVAPATPLAAGTCQWWIQTWNDAGYGPWSESLTFMAPAGGTPGKAVLLAPTGAINTQTPAFVWSAAAGSSWYLLWTNDRAGSAKINKWYTAVEAGCAAGTGICTVSPGIALVPGAAQWWIQTWNDAGTGPWSDAMNFTVPGGNVIPPLLSKTVIGISALPNDPDINVNAALLPASTISGTVGGAGQGLFVIASDGAGGIFSSSVNPLTGKYIIVVPAGTYTLKVCYQPAGTPSTETVIVTFVDSAIIPVSGDVTRDLTVPAVTLFNVSGTVSGLGALPAGGATTIVFTSMDSTLQGQFALDASGNYQGVLPAGNHVASVGRVQIPFVQPQSETLELYNLGSLVVTGGAATGNYTVPPMAKLSGTIRGGGLPSIPAGTSVTAADNSATPNAQPSCCIAPATSSATTNQTGQYQMALAKNRSYGVGITVQIGQGVSLLGVINYPLSGSVVSLAGDSTLDLTIPLLPRRPILFGRVTDASGVGIENVAINVYSQSIQDAANVGFSATRKTDANGNYSMAVLGGTNYRITFVPPAPTP